MGYVKCVCVRVCHVPLVFVAWFCLENGHKYTKKNAMLAGKLIFSNPSLGWNSSTQTTHFWPITSGILCVSLVEWFHGIRCWPGTRALLNLPFEFAHVPIFVGLYRYYMILYIYTYHACRLNPTLRFLRSQLLWLLVGWSPISIHLCCFMWGSKERTWRKREPRWH